MKIISLYDEILVARSKLFVEVADSVIAEKAAKMKSRPSLSGLNGALDTSPFLDYYGVGFHYSRNRSFHVYQ
jgi:hypothetical protein